MLTNKLRLYIIYFLIFVAVVAGCIGVAAKFEAAEMKLAVSEHSNKLDSANREISQLKEDKVRQEAALKALEVARSSDSTVLRSLSDDLHRLGLQHVSAMDKINQLERTNEQVKAFLDSPVPPDGCVLDASCEGRVRPGTSGSDQAETE